MKKAENASVRIIPLGGLEQIGMNITAIEYDDSIVVVDCGLSFPEEDMLGIDLVIPDVTYLKENLNKVKGFVITHGHEDHIGAIPYVLKDVNVPIYATKLTMGLIESKLKEHNMLKSVKRKVVKYGQSVTLGDLQMPQHLLYTHRQELLSTQEILRLIIHLYMVILLIFKDLVNLERRVYLHLCATVRML